MKPVINLPNNKAPIWVRKRLDQPRDSATSATNRQKPGTTAMSTPLAATGSSTAQNSPATGQQSEKCTGTTSTHVQSIELLQTALGLKGLIPVGEPRISPNLQALLNLLESKSKSY